MIKTTATHFEICKTALSANKHVFVEKPLAENDSEVDELIKELGADAEGKVSFEAFKSAECWKVNSKKIEELRKRPQGANRSGGAAGSSG